MPFFVIILMGGIVIELHRRVAVLKRVICPDPSSDRDRRVKSKRVDSVLLPSCRDSIFKDESVWTNRRNENVQNNDEWKNPSCTSD